MYPGVLSTLLKCFLWFDFVILGKNEPTVNKKRVILKTCSTQKFDIKKTNMRVPRSLSE